MFKRLLWGFFKVGLFFEGLIIIRNSAVQKWLGGGGGGGGGGGLCPKILGAHKNSAWLKFLNKTIWTDQTSSTVTKNSLCKL